MKVPPGMKWEEIHPERIGGSFRPREEVVHEHETKWVWVRYVQKPEGRFVSLDAKEAKMIPVPSNGITMLGIVQGVCLGETRAELDAVIAALTALRDRLP